MYFVKDLGVGAHKTELKALLSFVGEEGRLAEVTVTISGGKLLAWATNGHCGAYNHGTATDGKGKPYDGEHNWQIHSEALKMIHDSMGKKDEVIFTVSKKGLLHEARIRDIESSEERLKISIGEHTSEQLGIDMPAVVPDRPILSNKPSQVIALSPSLMKLVSTVSKAANCDCCRITVPESQLGQILVEVDQPGRLADSEQPAWVLVLMPLRIDLDESDSGNEEE